ncbi:UNVERIFIED_CONTAM: hypothetical protein Slati_3274300 [Sesamum latifolium]|uniref:Uncharacterized protein n=1 Tax=Sesamum latifolium TaxID=2727402 RepID=A0AAW2UZ34_9LAMI
MLSSRFSSRASSSPQKFGLVGWYLGMLKTRPISTKSITAALIYTAADVSSQTIVGESSEQYDLIRTLRMAGYGMLILGPSVHYWYNFMSTVFPKRDLLSTLKKMALGQTLYGPTMTVIFFSVNAALQATGNQLIFVPMDGLHNLHGGLNKSWFELRVYCSLMSYDCQSCIDSPACLGGKRYGSAKKTH